MIAKILFCLQAGNLCTFKHDMYVSLPNHPHCMDSQVSWMCRTFTRQAGSSDTFVVSSRDDRMTPVGDTFMTILDACREKLVDAASHRRLITIRQCSYYSGVKSVEFTQLQRVHCSWVILL